jgi:hypothetical protein
VNQDTGEIIESEETESNKDEPADSEEEA